MGEVKGLTVAIGSSTSEFESGLESVKGSLGGLGDFASSALGLLTNPIALATAAVVGIGAAAFSVGQDFEAAFNSIRVGTGATGENLEGLKEDFRGVFAGVPEDAATVSGAIGDLNTKLGLSGQPLQDLSTQFLNLARINKEDVTGAIDSTSKAFNAWGIESDAQGESLDYLFKVSQSTGVSVSDLSSKTTDAASTAKTLGLNFNETAALIGQLEKTTGDSSGAMAGLTKAVAEMTDAGIPAKDALGQIIGEIKEAPNATAAGQAAMEIFGVKAGPELAEKIRAGKFDLDEMMGAIAASPDTINGVAEDVATFGEKFDVLGNQVSLVLEPLGSFLVDGLTAVATFLADSFNPAMEFLGELWDGLISFIQPVIDIFKDDVLPALQSVGEVWLGLQLLLADLFIPVLQAVWNALKPVVTFIKDQVVFQIKAFFQNVQTLIGWLQKIPGVSTLVEAAQKRVKQAFSDTGTESDTAKGKLESLTGATDIARTAQDKMGAPGGSAPKLSAAIRDTGAAHNEAKEKVEKYTDAQNLAVEAANRAYEGEIALANQTGLLKDAFDDVEQPVIDVGGAVDSVNTSVLNAAGAMANADVQGSLDKWKTDADAKLPVVKGAFTEWGEGISSIVGSLSTGLTTKLFTDPGSFGAEALGKLKTIGQSFLDVFDTKMFGPGGVITGFINKGIGALTGALDGLISKITGGVGGALTSVFGGATSAAGNAAGQIGSTAGSAGGGAASAGGSATSGAFSTFLGVAGLGVAIADAVIGGMQRAKMNDRLFQIATSTDKTVRILGGENQDSGISKKLADIQEGVWFGPGVKATEDFRNKWWDFGLPVFQALQVQGAFVQPTLDHFGSEYLSQWGPKFDAIERNTAATEKAVRDLQGKTANNSLAIDQIKTAIQLNTGGLRKTIREAVPKTR